MKNLILTLPPERRLKTKFDLYSLPAFAVPPRNYPSLDVHFLGIAVFYSALSNCHNSRIFGQWFRDHGGRVYLGEILAAHPDDIWAASEGDIQHLNRLREELLRWNLDFNIRAPKWLNPKHPLRARGTQSAEHYEDWIISHY